MYTEVKSSNKSRKLSKNIYKMMCYIIPELNDIHTDRGDISDSETSLDMICKLMESIIDILEDHYYFEQYTDKNESRYKITGCIDIENSVKTGAYIENKLCCNYSELDTNNATNQLIKLALSILLDKLNFNFGSYSKFCDIQFKLSSTEDIEADNVDNEYREYCLMNQPYYCSAAINMSYFIIKSMTPNNGLEVEYLDTNDPTDSIIEEFIRKFYYTEYTRAISLSSSELNLNIPGDVTCGIKDRRIRLDVALRNSKQQRALIIDSKDYKKISDSDGIHQLIDYFHETSYKWSISDIDLVLLFSMSDNGQTDYTKQFHVGNNLKQVKIKYVDFYTWDFEDIKQKLIDIADETFNKQ